MKRACQTYQIKYNNYTDLTTPLTKPAATALTETPSAAQENVAHVIFSWQKVFFINLPFTDHNLSSLELLLPAQKNSFN